MKKLMKTGIVLAIIGLVGTLVMTLVFSVNPSGLFNLDSGFNFRFMRGRNHMNYNSNNNLNNNNSNYNNSNNNNSNGHMGNKNNNNKGHMNNNNYNNAQRTQDNFEYFDAIDANIEFGNVIIKSDKVFTIDIKECQSCDYRVNYKVNGGTLKTETNSSGKQRLNQKDAPEIIITTPVELSGINVDMDLGKLLIQDISVKRLEIEADANSTDLRNMNTDNASIKVNTGALNIHGTYNTLNIDTDVASTKVDVDTTKLYIENDLGTLDVRVRGSESDFNIDIENEVGSIQFDDHKISGVDKRFNQKGSTNKEIKIKNEAGKVKLGFNRSSH